jgi:hypothetical protein
MLAAAPSHPVQENAALSLGTMTLDTMVDNTAFVVHQPQRDTAGRIPKNEIRPSF